MSRERDAELADVMKADRRCEWRMATECYMQLAQDVVVDISERATLLKDVMFCLLGNSRLCQSHGVRVVAGHSRTDVAWPRLLVLYSGRSSCEMSRDALMMRAKSSC